MARASTKKVRVDWTRTETAQLRKTFKSEDTHRRSSQITQAHYRGNQTKGLCSRDSSGTSSCLHPPSEVRRLEERSAAP